MSDGGCQDLDPACCGLEGGTVPPGSTLCLGDGDGDGYDDACAPPCVPHPFGDVTDLGPDCPPPPPITDRSGCGVLIGLPDMVYVLNAFAAGGAWTTCYPNADVASALADPCQLDGNIALPDIVAVLSAFAGDDVCPSHCPCP